MKKLYMEPMREEYSRFHGKSNGAQPCFSRNWLDLKGCNRYWFVSPSEAIWHLAILIFVSTGGADGFGAAIVDRFNKEGCMVIFIDLNKEKGNQKAKANSSLRFISGDVTKRETWEEVLHYGKRTFGRIDVVVNNAGERNHSVSIRISAEFGITGITFDPSVRAMSG